MIAGIVAAARAGAGVITSYFNSADKSAAITLTNAGDKTATGSGAAWASVRSVTAHASGKWYAECVIDLNTITHMVFGVATSAASLSNFVGGDAFGWGLHANATNPINAYTGGVATNVGNGEIATNGRAYVAYDAGSGKIWLGSSTFSGAWAGGGDPAAGTSPTYTVTPGTSLMLALSLFSNTQTVTLKNNPGENTGAIPTGFTMWG